MAPPRAASAAPPSLLLLLLLAASPRRGSGAVTCPRGWEQAGAPGTPGGCFRVFCQPLNWMNAAVECTRYGAHLARIDNVDENLQVNMLFRGSHMYWIGANERGGREYDWRWPDGTPVQNPQWAPTEPNNMGGHDEECVNVGHCMRDEYERHLWNDDDCYQQMAFVCRLDDPGAPGGNDTDLGRHQPYCDETSRPPYCPSVPEPYEEEHRGSWPWWFWTMLILGGFIGGPIGGFYCCCHDPSQGGCPPRWAGCCTGGCCFSHAAHAQQHGHGGVVVQPQEIVVAQVLNTGGGVPTQTQSVAVQMVGHAPVQQQGYAQPPGYAQQPAVAMPVAAPQAATAYPVATAPGYPAPATAVCVAAPAPAGGA